MKTIIIVFGTLIIASVHAAFLIGGITLGAIPAGLLWGGGLALTGVACKAWDKAKEKDNNEFRQGNQIPGSNQSLPPNHIQMPMHHAPLPNAPQGQDAQYYQHPPHNQDMQNYQHPYHGQQMQYYEQPPCDQYAQHYQHPPQHDHYVQNYQSPNHGQYTPYYGEPPHEQSSPQSEFRQE